MNPNFVAEIISRIDLENLITQTLIVGTSAAIAVLITIARHYIKRRLDRIEDELFEEEEGNND